jgi:hypothetical protein
MHLPDIESISKYILVFIVTVFMPLTATSFFWYMIDKKEKDFKRAVSDMGINTSRTVRDTLSPLRFFLPVAFVTLICFVAMASFVFFSKGRISDSLLLSGLNFGKEPGQFEGQIIQSMSVLFMAFLGAFIWSAQTIIRRLIAADLSPAVYYSAGIRILMATVVALVLGFTLGGESNFDWLKSALPSIAFLTGMFPERILTWFTKKYEDYFNINRLNTETLSLDNIEGISLSHKERLSEIGIDNVQNLANFSITKLLIMTPFESRQLLDWIGQSKLLLYVKDDIEKLRSCGIRSIYDLYKGSKDVDTMRNIAESNGLNPMLLETIYRQTIDDEGVRALVNFQNQMDGNVNYASAKEEGLLERMVSKPPENLNS